MDGPPGIIAQVTQEGEQQVTCPTPDPECKVNPVIKTMKRRRNIFSPLLCCFGKRPAEEKPPLPVKPITTVDTTEDKELLSPGDKPLASPPQTKEILEENHNVISQTHLLPDILERDLGKKCIVIDLDETLVHSSFKPVENADFTVPVEIEGTVHQVYVLKRPHVDEFLQKMGELFECVLFTASLAKYADPVADLLDKWGVFSSRLFREHCVFHRGNYVKDLSRLGRNLDQVLIIDNSPASYIFHPHNAVPVSSWFDSETDTELMDLVPLFVQLAQSDSVYSLLKNPSA